jgi:hypothetical protein
VREGDFQYACACSLGNSSSNTPCLTLQLVRRETGKELVVQVHCDEGVANHIGLEPCAGGRETVGEASVGDRIGQPLSRERVISGRRRCQLGGRQYAMAQYRERQSSSARSQTLACADALCAGTGRSLDRPSSDKAEGPWREGEEP